MSIKRLCHEINARNLEVRRAADELIDVSRGKSDAALHGGLNSSAVMFPDSAIFLFHP